MEENLQNNNEEGLSLLDIIRVLFSKIVLLILVVILGGVCGGVFGVIHTMDMKYYGTSIEFYVNPEKPTEIGNTSNSTANAVGSQYGVYGAYGRHVMDAMIKLLSSESFTEQLLLEDDGLPSTEIYPNLSEEKYVNAQRAMQNAQAKWDNIADYDIARAEALSELKELWSTYSFDVSIGPFSESSCKKLIQNQTVTLPEYFLNSYEEFIDIDNERLAAVESATKIQKETDAIVEILLEEWREHPKYITNLNKFQDAVTYSYLGDDEDIEDANNLARSFIYVDISVLNDEEFAKDLLERVKRSVPAYIEQNMIVPTDYEGTSCTRITRTDDIRRTNPNFRRNQSIKYALLAAAAAGVIAAVLVIILDAQDKRLRDHEIITRKLKVPVLGIIPTIDEMNQAADTKKQNRGDN
jgi:capsular polysaccharide biosynthesis protein